MIDKSLTFDVLTAAMETGGDFAELFAENTERSGITMINGAVEKAQWGIDYGCGLRIFDGYNAVYAYTNDTSRESLLRMARNSAQVIGRDRAGAVSESRAVMVENIHKVEILPSDGSKKTVTDMLRLAADAAYGYDRSVTQTNGSYGSVIQNVLIVNSEGLWAEDRRVRTRVSFSAVASSEDEKQTGGFSPGASRGFEFTDSLDMKRIGEESASIAVTMLNASLCPSGRMPVIIENGFGGVIFHEACAHSLEATSVAKNASEFCGRLGTPIASEIVTAIDDGTIPGAWGSVNIDDEGTKTRRNVLIEKGVLKTYLVDRLNGIKLGMESTGSSRRESYKYTPTSRMTNTYIESGSDKQGDIIKDTEYGLYAKKMGGGSVQPSTGEFNFAVTEAYIIKNGKIAEPVRGATLIGKGSEVLANIDRISDNLAHEQGMCGSASGSVPTNVGQPMIRVKELTVGGRR